MRHPKSATAWIALSYAKQARFDLEGARENLQEAVRVDPGNALAWARLSDIQASFGDLDKALDSAKKAESLAPELSLTQTVLGFAYLTQVKIDEAKATFEKAISLDQAAPLPRLGLGLAKIRQGDLEAGGREIEIAASLDPNNSLIRSYLGKTYYEEKRIPLDEKEYAIAKELDPNDPTPMVLRCHRQADHQPAGGGFADHGKGHRTQRQPGGIPFQTTARLGPGCPQCGDCAGFITTLVSVSVAFWKVRNSVNTDPSDFSGHRFLADTYSVLPRHEIARVSELLQSQLLQPINITPIQPRLGGKQPVSRSALRGPSQTSFNEFNPIFNRNRAAVQASGLVGENSTWAGEGIVSGIYNKLSLSAGYNHFETDGWRINADQDDDIANIFAQYELTYNTSIQAEYRYRDTERGDNQLRFFEDDYLPNLRTKEDSDLIRLGVKHSFSPGSILLGNFSYQDKNSSLQDEPFPEAIVDAEFDEKAYSGELQYQFRSDWLSVVSGAGYNQIDQQGDQTLELTIPETVIPLPPPLPPIILPAQTITDVQNLDADTKHTNLYLYSNIYLPHDVTLTVGGSGDFYKYDQKNADNLDQDFNQFNPKFGILWNPFDTTTLRGAIFRVLKRTLISNQTLEPTQVAGFNQFYDDVNATDAWLYGAGIDQKFLNRLYGGAEFTLRDLEVPSLATDVTSGISALNTVDWKEKLFRGYLYYTPHDWIALTAEYLWERFERDELFADGAENVTTNYFPLGINFFHPCGLSAYLKGTYVDQSGNFERQGSVGIFEKGEDNFWLVDAAISYRLPKRYGFVTIGAKNLFDEKFQYYDTDRKNPRIQPDRNIFCKLTLAFP